MSTATIASPAVTAFSAAVRGALSDLTSDEVEDLTDGLEADLTERIADGGTTDLGDPAAYAEELRAAAGLPKRAKLSSGSSVIAELRLLPARIRREVGTLAARYPAIAGIGRFLVSLRPLWWTFRAVAVTWLLVNLFQGYLWAPISGPTVALFLAMVVLSVQFGRGRWLPFAWMRGLLLVANIVLAISAPFVVAGVVASINNVWYSSGSADSYPDYSRAGLTLDGNQVSNVFAYDAQGNPLTDVQLFDQDGKPLNLVGDPTATSNQDRYPAIIVPNQSVPGRLGWNVYPLSHVNASDLNDDGSIKQSVAPTPAVAPFATAKPLAGATSAPTPSAIPSAEATGSPTAFPTATPTPAP
jgi:hypothetical protein